MLCFVLLGLVFVLFDLDVFGCLVLGFKFGGLVFKLVLVVWLGFGVRSLGELIALI